MLSSPVVTTHQKGAWLEVLCNSLEKLGVPVVACRAYGGEVELVLEESFEVTLTKGSTELAFTTVAGISIRYRGNADAKANRALALLVRLLEKLAAKGKVPDDLESSHLRGIEAMPPHRALSFAFPFCTAERSHGEEGAARIEEVLIRLTGRCNQECPFCSAPPPLAEPSLESVVRLLDLLDSLAPGATLTFTGGEPTLRDDLPDLVGRALASSPELPARDVEIQTNAVRLAKADRVAAFPTSSRLRFFVSLHALDESIYDECTGTTTMMPRAIEGIRNLLNAGYPVVLSVVANRWNAAHLTDLVDLVATYFDGPVRPTLHFSITLCSERRQTAARSCLIRYAELSPHLQEAYRRARDSGLHPEPLLSSTHAAIPACFLEQSLCMRKGPPPIMESQGPESGRETAGWRRGPRCRECSFSSSCWGVPMAYAERFGLEELK